MQGLRGVHRALEEQVARQVPPDLGPVCELSGPELLEAEEREVARLLILAAVGSYAGGGPPVTGALLAVSSRYQERSFLCTGRSLPRAGELIGLLDAAVAARSPRLLAEVADHLGQGWPGYPDSVFPTALAALAARLDPAGAAGPGSDRDAGATTPGSGTISAPTPALASGSGATSVPRPRAGTAPVPGAGEFAVTSFICRERGLRYAAAGRAARAADLLRDASRRYQASAYRADAAWLFTDVILAELMAGQVRRAAAVGEEQRRFVEEVFTTLPPATGPGAASAFTRPVGLRPRALTPEDHEMLLRYVRTSQFLVEACRHRSAEDFAAAVDLMSFGWAGFAASPYPRILRHLADRYAAPGAPWEVHLGADGWWHRMLRSSRVQVTSAHLVATAVALRARLGRAGLLVHGDVALLDAAVVHARLYGTAATVEWVTRYVAELRPRIPGLLRTAVTYLQASSGQEAARLLASYTALRTACAAPDLLCAAGLHPAGPLPPAGPDGVAVRGARSPRLEVAFYGNLLSVEGITIHRVTPAPLTQLLRVLGEEFVRAGERGEEVPFLSAGELSARTGRTPAALAQTVRRFRAVCQDRFAEATTCPIGPETVIQGRPGYRLNPDSVELFRPPPPPVPPAPLEPSAPRTPRTTRASDGTTAPAASRTPATSRTAPASRAVREARTSLSSPVAGLSPTPGAPSTPHPGLSASCPPAGSGPAPSTRSLL
ncbi:hypothetical protein M1P56_18515 [Streptomyces sp. HU2014]|uniref:hypothetical protein n=1 Tax=Streptomyces sp. HU2014 TaxID=2939414 RepID=UPI00200E2B55|nr:hypothetical protein [Streptomyces sp. HU2014]UQI46189.1 hypothetical protein M1P56_18515 [Streptomyces sp. HU2014]